VVLVWSVRGGTATLQKGCSITPNLKKVIRQAQSKTVNKFPTKSAKRDHSNGVM